MQVNLLSQAKVDSCYQFTHASSVIAAIPRYIKKLSAIAQDMEAQGKEVEDQQFPVDILSLHPSHPIRSPLILLGGMGPLAGAISFQQACQFCGHDREIILYQACGIPSRISVMSDPNHLVEGMSLNHRLVRLVSDSIRDATDYLQAESSTIHVVLLCNAVHYFLPQIQKDLQKRYPTLAHRLNFISIVDAVLEMLQSQRPGKILVLGTTATQIGRVYSQPLKRLGINYKLLPNSFQSRLMDIIYCGVKAFNQAYACQMGHQFFNSLLQIASDVDFMIAGCTEIPILLDWLQIQSTRDHQKDPTTWLSAQQFLAQVEVLDPVCLALQKRLI